MSSAPPGKRVWNCPDCGGEVLLSMTQLDPLACPACVTKLKGGSSPAKTGSGVTGAAGGPLQPLQIVAALPESVKLAGVGIVALLLGLLIGFVAGRVTAPQSTVAARGSSVPAASPSREPSRSTSRAKEIEADEEPIMEAERPNEATRPSPNSKWSKGYTRKDGVKVRGHWMREANSDK